MATTSIWRVNGWLGKVLIYIENPDKTENPDFFEKQDMDGKEAQGLPQGRGAMFSAEQNAILVKKGMDAPDIFRCVSLEVANVQLAQSMDGYSRETDGYKAYAVSYMLCKRYGVDAKEYEISKLDGVFQGQVPREDIPAALTDMRDAFKSLNGRMARAMGLTRDSKQKEQER